MLSFQFGVMSFFFAMALFLFAATLFLLRLRLHFGFLAVLLAFGFALFSFCLVRSAFRFAVALGSFGRFFPGGLFFTPLLSFGFRLMTCFFAFDTGTGAVTPTLGCEGSTDPAALHRFVLIAHFDQRPAIAHRADERLFAWSG
jgi:hypothetical protein